MQKTDYDHLQTSGHLTDNSLSYSAQIFCWICNEDIAIKQYGRLKKSGGKGAERWVISNFETHLRKHVGKMSPKLSASEPNIMSKFLVRSEKSTEQNNKTQDDEVIDSETSPDKASGEELSRKRQERVLLEQKNPESSSRKTQEVDNTEIKDSDIDQ